MSIFKQLTEKMKKKQILTKDFFERDTKTVARELLGKVLYRRSGNQIYRGIISETEAYHGTEDLACHCSKGKTPRTEVMFGEPGHIYIYLIYGMYQMLNFVTMKEGFPAAVLIRGIKDAEVSSDGIHFTPLNAKTDGPGKLTRQLQIDKKLNKKALLPASGLWVADENINIPAHLTGTSARIGIDYAGEWKHKPWRFFIKET